jgi:hypothetical protein
MGVRRLHLPEFIEVVVLREEVHVMRTSCTRAQVNAFRTTGEALLAEMARALDQEAVAYETRQGLTVLHM